MPYATAFCTQEALTFEFFFAIVLIWGKKNQNAENTHNLQSHERRQWRLSFCNFFESQVYIYIYLVLYLVEFFVIFLNLKYMYIYIYVYIYIYIYTSICQCRRIRGTPMHSATTPTSCRFLFVSVFVFFDFVSLFFFCCLPIFFSFLCSFFAFCIRSVSMYVSMYVCIYVCIYVCMCVYMCACMYACMFACMCVCIYLCMYVYTYMNLIYIHALMSHRCHAYTHEYNIYIYPKPKP